jgi:hypothetical protein
MIEYLIIGFIVGAALGFGVARHKYRVPSAPTGDGGAGRPKEKDDR